MARSYWLAKSEPSAYSWQQFVSDGSTYWDGVRNYQARNNLNAMQQGDWMLFYHSVKGCEVIGIARVTHEAYPDPTTDDERWVVVDLEPLQALERPVPLSEIKADPTLRETGLVKQSRLSVMPLTRAQFDRILKLGRTRRPKG